MSTRSHPLHLFTSRFFSEFKTSALYLICIKYVKGTYINEKEVRERGGGAGGVVYGLIMGYEGSLGTSFSVNINNLRNTKTEHLNKLETTNLSRKAFHSFLSIYFACLFVC